MDTRPRWDIRSLGNTNLRVTTLGIGGGWLGHSGDGVDEQVGVETVLRGLESGMNLVDTSGQYLGGRSEVIIGRALSEWFSRGNRRQDLVISTKTGTRVRPHDYSCDFTVRSVETSLTALGLDYIDILFVHDPQSLEGVFATDGALSALRRLKEQGVIRAIGLGCRSHEHHRTCIDSGEFEVCLTHSDYNLISRTSSQGVIGPADRRGVGIINGSIMLHGFLGGADPSGELQVRSKKHGRLDPEVEGVAQRLWQWCQDRQIDLGALNLQFCLREPRIASTVLGFSRPQRVDQNIEAYLSPMDDQIWTELGEDFDLESPITRALH